MCRFVFIVVVPSIAYLFLLQPSTTVGAIQCAQPEIPENGHGVIRQVNNMSIGSIVTYQCDVGFILVGLETRTCESNGAWSGNVPTCALNVALYKPASQSSTLDEGGDSQNLHFANLSTDGNFEGSCSSTKKEKVSWWQVDLLETYNIYAVELLLPSSLDGKLMDELHIFTSINDDFSPKNKSVSLCYKHEGPLASEWQCGAIKDMTTWGAFGGKCYYGSLESMPWFSANTQCEINGASLATEIDAGIHQYLISQIKYRSVRHAQSYWLGLSNNGKEWRWLNGKSVKTSFWSDPAAKDVASTNMAYAAAMALPFQWSWMPSLQALWYFWICQATPKFCSSPGLPHGGGIMVSNQMYSIGSNAYYFCNTGFVVEGETTRTCLENGTWSGTLPKCIAVDCGRPDVFLGASVKYLNESTSFGTMVEYQCPLGQKIAGTAIRTCQADSKWSGKLPKCEDLDCGYPGDIDRGRVFLAENSSKIGSIAEYSCDDGFGLIGASVRHCSTSGLWVPSQIPACYDVKSLQATPAPSSGNDVTYQTNLMTGFIVAVVILLVIIVIVVFYMWKKKKLYDTFSMSTMYTTNSQLANSPINNACSNDLLYAFPAAVAPPPKENTYYHEPTICHTNNNDIQVIRANDSYQFDSINEMPNINLVNTPTTVFGDGPQYYIAINRPATAEQLERVVNNINLTLSACRKQQPNNRPKLATAFHTMRQPQIKHQPLNVADLFRQKLSEFLPPQSQPHDNNTSAPAQSSSPTPSELFSFDDDDDVDYVDERETRSGDQHYCPSNYSNASTQQQDPTAQYDDIADNDLALAPPTSMYAVSSVLDAGGEQTKIYDLPPDAAAKMNENLAKVLLKQIGMAQENVYEVPCPDANSFADTANCPNVQEKVLLGNGVEIVHTYC